MSGFVNVVFRNHIVTLVQYSVILKRLSVRGSHSVALYKTHVENEESVGSQTGVLRNYRLIQ